MLFTIPFFIFLLSYYLSHYGLLKRMDNFLYDLPFRWRTAPFVEDVTLVGITQESLEKLGKFPWPRSIYARLIDQLQAYGAKTIVFDIFYPVPSQDRQEDEIFSKKIKESGNILLPVFAPGGLKKENNRMGIYFVRKITHNLSLLEKNAIGVGHINCVLDEDGVLRRQPLFISDRKSLFPYLPLAAYLYVKGERIARIRKGCIELTNKETIPLDYQNHFLIPYYSNLPLSIFSFHEVLEGKVPEHYFKDRVVIIGQITEGLPNADTLNTPVGRKFGVIVLTNTLISLLNKDFLKEVPFCLYFLFSIFCVYVNFLIFLSLRKIYSSLFALFSSLFFLFFLNLHFFLYHSLVFSFTPISFSVFLVFWYANYLNYRKIYLLLTWRETQLRTVEEVSQVTREVGGFELMRSVVETLGKSFQDAICILREGNIERKRLPILSRYVPSGRESKEIIKFDGEKVKEVLKGRKEMEEGEAKIGEKKWNYLIFPLKIGPELVGTLSLYRESRRPFNPEERRLFLTLIPQISVALKNLQLYRDTRRLFLESIQALTAAIDAKDPYTEGHSQRVTWLALEIARVMGLSEESLERLRLAALLHDIGKIGIEEKILRKAGNLSKDEYEVIKKHPMVGAQIILPIRELKDIMPAIQYHHERWDGKGYPKGLKGEEIPLFARIIAVADAFDAMTSDRPYRKAKNPMEAAREIIKNSGTQFDPRVVEAFEKVILKKWKISKV